MSQKKATGTASKKTTSIKPPTNASTKAKPAAAKKAPAKAPTKAATKSSTKVAPKAPARRATKPTSKTPAAAPPKTAAKVAANTSKKRKATDELEEQEPKVNGVKRARTTSKSATPAPAAAVAEKPKAVKAPKKKAVINNAPTDRLDVYVFGTGDNGELGLGSAKGQTEVKRPRLNPLLAADKVGVVSMSVGGMHAAVLTQNNKIMTWGVNDQGALGRDTSGWQGGLKDVDDNDSDRGSDDGSDTDINPLESTPTEIDTSGLPEGIVWTQLACTDSATFALTDEGLVYGWGTFRGNEGILGFNPYTLVQRTPILVDRVKNITQLAVGANHVLALSNKGEVYAWGSGQQNQLGRRILERTKVKSLVPTQFGLPKQIVLIGAGSYHSFAVHENGQVYAWGLNSFGETGYAKDIGDGGEADVHHATVIDSLSNFGKVISIDGGAHHTVAVTDEGECLVWGRLDGGQLGLEISTLPEANVVRDSANKPRILQIPTQVPGIDAAHAAAGTDHCVVVAKDGKAFAWGFSINYQTGLGTDEDVEVAKHIDNTATRGKKLIWAGCGGQFSALAGISSASMVNGA